MQLKELRRQHRASALRGLLLFLYEQPAQYLRGLAADITPYLARIPCKGLRSELRRVRVHLVTWSRLMILLFAPCITNLVVAAPATGHPDTTILRPNHISCVDEGDVARLAAINDEIDLRTTITGFIVTGQCAAVSNPTKVVELAEKTSASGSTYYCYRRIDYALEDSVLIEVVAPTPECNIGQFITTLQKLIAERTGEFKAIGSDPFGATAICSEGGRVTLRIEDSKVFRTAYVLPGAFQRDILAEPEIMSAFRSGCKGVDAIR